MCFFPTLPTLHVHLHRSDLVLGTVTQKRLQNRCQHHVWRALRSSFRSHANVDTNPTPVRVIAISAPASFVCAATMFQISQMGHLDWMQIIKYRGKEMSSWSAECPSAKAHGTINMKQSQDCLASGLFSEHLGHNLSIKNNTESWLHNCSKKFLALVSYVTTSFSVFFLSLMYFERWLLDSLTRTLLVLQSWQSAPLVD